MVVNVFQSATATASDDGTLTIYFQINKLGNTYTLSYSQDGANFTSMGSVTANYADPKLVLIAGQNTDNEPVWLNFEYIAITSKDGVDANSDFLTWARQNVADYIAADLPARTSNDIELSPAPHGYAVTLESSNPAVIAADGKVTPAKETQDVELTVTVTEGEATATAKATVKVPGTESGEPEVDRTALDKAITDAEAIDKTKYTDETVAALEAALADAKAVPADADQAAVDAAAAALNAAIAALVEKGDVPVTKYKVTFDFNFPGAPDPVVVEVEEGKTVEAIEAPAREGYVFSSWGTERSFWGMTFISPYDFSTPVTADLTLKASWSKDWSRTYSLAEEYADFFPFGNFGTQSPNGDQVTYEYNTYSGNSGKMTYNFGANESKSAYDAAVAEINADTTLSDEEKAAKIKEADGIVKLGGNNPLQSDLNRIQQWNEQHPEGPKKYYRQHVIAWHGSEQAPAFYHEGFDTSKPLASKEVMNARLDSYIEAMFKRYQPWDDIIISWDIVNEALDDYNGMVRNATAGTARAGARPSWTTRPTSPARGAPSTA